MPFGLGIWEIAILVGVILLVVGPAKAPGVVKSLHRGVREVKETVEAPQREIRKALLGDGGTAATGAQPAQSSSDDATTSQT